MTAHEQKLIEQNLRRRAFHHETPDPIAEAAIISDKVKKSSCFGAVVAGALVLVTVVAVIGGAL